MRPRTSLILWLGAALGCDGLTGPRVPPPANLTYQLEVSGDPKAPAGILWRWDAVDHPDLQVYRVYSRPERSGPFGLRASTTSTTFHDRGIPHLEYYVVSVDLKGRESEPTDVVLVDERLRLDAPAWLASTSLNGAIHLWWSDNPFTTTPEGFKQYHVYSTSYSVADNLCGSTWLREGTTIAPEFLVGVLMNGRPTCFAVSAESIEGWESLWSPLRADTPRPDARNVLVWAADVDESRSGFRFFQDVNGNGQVDPGELGLVGDGARSDVDFRVDRDAAADFFLVPVRSGTEFMLYSAEPIADLTSIDVAPASGYARAPLRAVPRFGYVFRITAGDPLPRYGALRVTHVGREYIIFDWSYQTDPGNPELGPRTP